MRARTRRLLPLIPAVLLPSHSLLAQTPPPIVTGGAPLGLQTVTTFSGGPPLALDYAPGDANDRLFIAGQINGQVKLLKNGTLQATPFLDVTTSGVSLSTGAGTEKGLLGIAFHPNFFAASNVPGSGKFYTFTSEVKGANTTGVDFIHPELVASNLGDCDSVIREWSVSTGNPDVINTAAGSRVIMRLRKPQSNHNGGNIRFGPDGYLYIGTGDGGGGNDFSGSATSTTDGHTNSSGNAQDITQIYGKMLRIDPLNATQEPSSTDPLSTNGQYHIPTSNPFSGATAGLDEIFAYGLRNPWRWSFDRGGTHQLYAGDVGQSGTTAREEVDIVTNGGNFGWVYKEGTLDNAGSGRTAPVGFTSIAPIAQYTHSDGQAIIGGYIYRGNDIPELSGKYVFGDEALSGAGRLFYSDSTGGTITEFTYSLNAPTSLLYSFGEGPDGELYAMFSNGTVAKLLGRQWMTNGGGSWNTSGNWLGGIPNAVGASANFLRQLSSGPATVTLDGSKTVGFLRFNNALSYTINGGTGGTLTLDNASSSPSLLQVISGNHTLNVPISIPTARIATLDVAAGSTLTLGSSFTTGASLSVTKTGEGSILAKGLITFNFGTAATSLHINAGNLILAPNSPTPSLQSLAFAGDGRLDLTNNAAVINAGSVGTFNGTTYTGVTGQIQSGRNGGNWSGSGIVTSQTAATSSVLTSIGIATGAQVKGLTSGQTAVWKGQTVGSGSILVMYTYGGDTNLDGKINVDDYGRIDFNVPLGTNGWYNGDFNYDGKINVDDYGIIDFNVADQGAPFSTSASTAATARVASVTAVPEPVLLPLIALFTFAPRRRMRRCARLR